MGRWWTEKSHNFPRPPRTKLKKKSPSMFKPPLSVHRNQRSEVFTAEFQRTHLPMTFYRQFPLDPKRPLGVVRVRQTRRHGSPIDNVAPSFSRRHAWQSSGLVLNEVLSVCPPEWQDTLAPVQQSHLNAHGKIWRELCLCTVSNPAPCCILIHNKYSAVGCHPAKGTVLA